ncbi:Protein MLP1-like protein [Golovinomyces cichoracearum]|uniref:Protein MLP1-like protein n=1 Tax=Golovinomyces cichoracearum TaxID=62708 RepID=A0A420IQ78_9PEZI|nr:Protein MLP1-like protein [Golovinomyces cichoracearum]
MATTKLDIDFLSNYLSSPRETLSSFIDSPNTELVLSILNNVIEKAREHDELAAEKLRIDIELENVVRNAETRIDNLKLNLEKAQKTVEEIRIKLNENAYQMIENTRSSLESELRALKSTSAMSTGVVESLQARISVLEAANRDTMAVVELKNTANDELAKELQLKHQKCTELSQQISILHQEIQTVKSAASSSSFREGAIKQELDLAKKNNEWLETELKTKSTDAMKYRKEKGAQVVELQRQNEELTLNLDELKKTKQALRSRVDELEKITDDSLSKIQQLEENAAKIEDGYRQEIESSRRLSELQTEQTQMHRSRIIEVEADIEKVKANAAEEVGRSRAEAEAERKDREQAEHRIAQLESEVDRLETLISQGHPVSRPGTPLQFLNGSLSGYSSQTRTPGSTRNKPMITATQAIEELGIVRIELKRERMRSNQLEAQIDEMVEGLEAKKPYVDELELENKRLEKEVLEMSKFVDQAGKERENATKETRKFKSEASTAQAEAKILSQQLRDLSSQVKILLADQAIRDQGWEALSPAEKYRLECSIKEQGTENNLDELSSTDSLISQRLVLFRNISELQQKNQEQLKLIRQLGAQMESEEAQAAKNQAAQDHEEVQRLLTKIESYKDELNCLITRSESYIKERDMFRRMLQHRGQIPPNADLCSLFGQSVQDQKSCPNNSNESFDSKSAELTAAIRNLQAQYDQYREEQTVDRKTLKEQVTRLSQEKSALQAEISKVNSQLNLATDRFDLLNSNYTMLSNENKELQKRSQIYSETTAKQDLRTQQVAEDLVEAKGLLEVMRNENSNLKAEKNLWKNIQDRLSQDNENLMNERTRLNTLIASQQNLQNEREHSDSETRRRLQSQIESLESELNTTKRKLNDEIEDSKKAQLRKEYESQQNQKRIDELVSSLSHVREELIAVKTSRDHLKSRVDELTIELKSSEERIQLLQPRNMQRKDNSGHKDTDLSREQELLVEVSELKRDLDLLKSELENAKIQKEQFKSIAQSTEEEIQSLNSTSDQFREEMDRVIGSKDAKIRELEQRVEDISAELMQTNNELTILRNQQGEITRRLNEDKASLQVEINRLKDEEERNATAAKFHQQDLRAQAEIATKAQQDYENELVKHADAAKQLQGVRAELNQMKMEAAALKSDAESSRAALSQNEISWKERCRKYEQELKELHDRRDDLNSQNKILYEQLENLNKQVSSLQLSRTVDEEITTESLSATNPQDRSIDGLRELNVYLRREKEILEVQYELKSQESKRLNQQLEYTQSQLDETRLKLDQERRSQADVCRSSIAHKDLLDKLNELNLFRESSTTLRNELRQSQSQLAEKTERVEELTEQIQPLKTRIHELEHRQETLEGEMVLLQEDRDRWQKRTQDIISKYDRIDPADMEVLKETIESLRAERDALLEDKQDMKEKINGFETEKNGWTQSRQKLIEQAKERNRINTKDIKDRTSERDVAIQEKETLQQQLSEIQKELQIAIKDRDDTVQQLSILRQELDTVISERNNIPIASSQLIQSSSHPVHVQQNDVAIDEELSKLRQDLKDITQEKKSLEEEVSMLREQLEIANSQLESNKAKTIETRETDSVQDFSKEVETSSNDEQTQNFGPKNTLTNAERIELEELVKAAEAKVEEYEKKAKRMEEEMEIKLKKRSDTMKSALNKKLAESKQTQKAELEAEYKLKFEQDKQIWIAESTLSTQTPSQPSNEKPTQIETEVSGTSTALSIPAQEQITEKLTLSNISEDEARQLCQNNKTIRDIIKGNIMSKLSVEIQKAKDEHAKALADAQQKADTIKAQAVSMESKKSALKINMTENRVRVATGKLQIVELAAQNTPERAVGEVWNEVKVYKPPPVISSSPAIATSLLGQSVLSNGKPSTPSKLSPVKQNTFNQAPSDSTNSAGPNGIPASLDNVKTLPQSHPLPQRVSSIPMIRGGGNTRGRGIHQNHQLPRGGGSNGRGRGGISSSSGSHRGGIGPIMGSHNSPGLIGTKRQRDDGPIGTNSEITGGKRPRGG